MDRIADAFSRCREAGRPAFIAYVCAGDPDAERSLAACRSLLAGGIDVLELGVPFSDPLADGLTNQLAAQRAIRAGASSQSVFAQVRAVRARDATVPIVFYTYYNLVHAHGVEAYVRDAKAAGVDGLLTLDCPPEEAGELLEACRAHEVRTVFIVAPTTPPERMARIAAATSGFIYYVSLEGVTGVRDSVAADIGERVVAIRAHTELPVVVGFGISRPEHVEAVGRVADGVVVGSALVNVIAEHAASAPEALAGALAERLGPLVAALPKR